MLKVKSSPVNFLTGELFTFSQAYLFIFQPAQYNGNPNDRTKNLSFAEFLLPGGNDIDIGLDWHLLEDSAHSGIQSLVRDLNALYRSTAALHARDCEAEGFEWIDANDSENSVLSFLRRADEDLLPYRRTQGRSLRVV